MANNLSQRGDGWLAPLIVLPNVGLAAFNTAIAATAGLTGMASRAIESAGVPLAGAVADSSDQIGARARAGLKESIELVEAGVRTALGRESAVPSTSLLARTLIDEGFVTAAWPAMALASASAPLASSASQGELGRLGMLVSKALAAGTPPGVLPAADDAVAVARVRKGFVVMVTNPSGAIFEDVRGMIGGLAALAVGDPLWLANGLRTFRRHAEYVYEKAVRGELGPGSNLPMSPALAKLATEVVEGFPETFVQALEQQGLRQAFRVYFSEPAAVNRMYQLYLRFTLQMFYDIAVFLRHGVFDAPDAQKCTLCELAVMESQLTDDEKDAALFEVRKTAPKAIIEFEHYVPLLVPSDGTSDDKACYRNASGAIVDHRNVVPSVFSKDAIWLAQSVNAEAYSLRSFLWLYRDEQLARAINDRETRRKFGPEAARRIAEHPVYPLAPEEIARLTKGGPRPAAEVEAILDGLLRERGLAAVADSIRARRSRPIDVV